jgi:hypothetical protein
MAFLVRAVWLPFVGAKVGPSEEGLWSWVPGINKQYGEPTGSAARAMNLLTAAVLPPLAAALLTVVFLVSRFRRACNYVQDQARTRPDVLVQTRGTILGDVVGRDELCHALLENLRDPRNRRPHVVVAGVGAGKTALLVRLTRMLPDKKAVPVPISLRDAQEGPFDLSELAKQRFLEIAKPKLRSAADGEVIWKRLRYVQDRIVVLADGLEEAYLNTADRDNVVRSGVRKAVAENLPVVITSRPHDALNVMEAAVIDLELLGEEAAIQYLSAGVGQRVDQRELDRVVEAAGVSEAPLYLEIAKDLNTHNLLADAMPVADKDIEPESQDQWQLRYDLADRWLRALMRGDLREELPLDYGDRWRVVEYLSALACIGLREDTSEVDLTMVHNPATFDREITDEARKNRLAPYRPIWKMLYQRLDDLAKRGNQTAGSEQSVGTCDLRTAAGWGARMGLVEERAGERVRFRNTMMQAFLGSRYLDAVVEARPQLRCSADDRAYTYFPSALDDPGREVLTAMIFHARRYSPYCRCANRTTILNVGRHYCQVNLTRRLLLDAAAQAIDEGIEFDSMLKIAPGRSRSGRQNSDCVPGGRSLHCKALDMTSAALDVDAFDRCSLHETIVEDINRAWPSLRDPDPKNIQLSKDGLVRRLAAAARILSRRDRCSGGPGSAEVGYLHLFQIACRESSYPVRLRISWELGQGGDEAFNALERAQADLVSLATAPPCHEPGKTPKTGTPRPGDREVTAAQRVRDALSSRDDREWDDTQRVRWEQASEIEKNRPQEMRARIYPMLLGTISKGYHDTSPHAFIRDLVKDIKSGGVSFAEQEALAQGFKLAANRRIPVGEHSHIRHARDFLIEQAWSLIDGTHYWYVRLTLLHALTLWALPDDVTEPSTWQAAGANPRAQVDAWLSHPRENWKRIPEHPLVEAARQLCVRTLQTRHPDRFLWIDEALSVTQAGSVSGAPCEPRWHNLWISPAAGWNGLDPQAQQLLGDVLILLIITERGDRPEDQERRFTRTDTPPPSGLPPCFSKTRAPLDPRRTVVQAAQSRPGTKCPGECLFKLCPYPPKGPDCRVEFTELFCMAQQRLLNRWRPWDWLYFRFRRESRWQRGVPASDLRRFWAEMEERVANVAADKPKYEEMR